MRRITRSIASSSLLLLMRVESVLSQGVDLNGGIVTRTDVKEYADLSLDVRDIRDMDSTAQILGLYEEGRHSEVTQQGGSSYLFSLKKLSTELSSSDLKTPHYLFQLYGLADEYPLDYMDHAHYSHTIIENAIKASQPVADTIIALSMWMYASHLLYTGVFECDVRSSADNPNVVPLGGGGMDEFIAMWIGTDQTPGSFDGHGLYAWTQRVAHSFGTATPEAKANRNLKLLYQEGASALSLNGACTRNNKKVAQELWTTAVQMSSQMMVPLYQWLLFSLSEQAPKMTDVYARAVIPQLSQCRPSVYKRLKQHLLDNTINFGKTEEIIRDLQATYSCFGLTCSDIGVRESYPETGCEDSLIGNPVLAGFSTTSDVRALSHIDHDIHQLRVLTSMGSMDFASMIYRHGRNVPKPRDSENDPFELVSLHELAVSADRSRAGDVYEIFLAYHPNDQNYADTAITTALDGSNSKWGNSATARERAEVVGLTSSFQIIYLEIIARLHDAYKACQDADSEVGFVGQVNPLDEAAALIIGAMEGDKPAGHEDAEDGQLLWNLANKRAFEFETLNRDEYASVNGQIQDLLYAAKGELEALDCSKLEREVLKLEKYLTIGVSQSVMSAAIEGSTLPTTATHPSLVQGEVFALSILPLVSFKLPEAGAKIARNMVVNKAQPTHVPDGAQVVADGLGEFTARGLLLPCGMLGGNANVEPCRNYGGRTASSSSGRQWPLLSALVISAAAGALLTL